VPVIKPIEDWIRPINHCSEEDQEHHSGGGPRHGEYREPEYW
jgi:hypothetical protein